jgi:ATP-dependent Lon protease
MASNIAVPPSAVQASLPALAPPTVVVFPGLITGLAVDRPVELAAVERASTEQGLLASFHSSERGNFETAAEIGVSARIVRLVRTPEGPVHLALQGVARVRRLALAELEPAPRVMIEEIHPPRVDIQNNPLRGAVLDSLRALAQLSGTLPPPATLAAANATDAGELADIVAGALELDGQELQRVLELIDPLPRLELALQLCEEKRRYLELSQQIQRQVAERSGRMQREQMLREQLQAIQRELGQLDPTAGEVSRLREEAQLRTLPDDVRAEVERELDRLESVNPASPEHAVIRTRLDWILALPWEDPAPENIDLEEAKRVLDADHYGLTRVKERILDQLAVAKLRGGARGTILCFVGPPGVGKTSLGQSVARALGRPFVRAALGGIRDEADIRGHRRTYIGALPGRIIEGMRRAGARNPVFMLDEIDKLSASFQGDPAAALLEVLDPAQNNSFRDNYLDIPYDLSRVFFICTANVIDTIPGPLLDRMEVIEIPGYTDAEKLQIARRHLLPRQLSENGLPKGSLEIDDDTLLRLTRGWTREAGVRQLERRLAAVCRKVARRRASGDESPVTVTEPLLTDWLGPSRPDDPGIDAEESIGAATGLAWTPAGGDVLTVEATVVPGRGDLTLTGHLGDVMRESARAAITFGRSRASQLGLAGDFFQTHDIHIHVPAGAVPKDGPSAGVTLATALISAATNRPVDRRWAMTGEITLRGVVMPVGGIKEKVLAAHRIGLRGVILPKPNQRDLYEVPEDVRNALEWRFVSHVDEVLATALKPEMAVPGV